MAVGHVYCTLVTSDDYLPGAAVLAKSLRDASTTKELAVMVTIDALRSETLRELATLYDHVITVDRIANRYPQNLYMMDRPDLLYTFTKINLWRQTQFHKIVYIDADIVALRAPDELFDIDAAFAAAPDIGWPDLFNSGVMMLTPNMGDFWALKALADCGDSFDGADQGLFNQYYEHKPWQRLSFKYNCTPSASYQYEPAYRYHKSGISMIHFIGNDKPWRKGRQVDLQAGVYRELLNKWWAVYDRHYRETNASSSIVVPSMVYDELAQSAHPAEQQATRQKSEYAGETAHAHHDTNSVQWDGTRASPPLQSRGEAKDLPLRNYDFTDSLSLFQAPKSYPMPSNVHYDIPESRPGPTGVFPWEDRASARPTRVFADDPSFTTRGFTPTTDEERPEPKTPRITISLDDESKLANKNRNAWDDLPEIDQYIRRHSQLQKLRGSVQVLSNQTNHQAQSPIERESSTMAHRRESFRVTDFPSAEDRPSLPVTPAPIRRPRFWDGERDDSGELPSASGVPDQVEWDPEQKLEELRQHSLHMDSDSVNMHAKHVPRRSHIPSAQPMPLDAAAVPPQARPDTHVHFDPTKTDTPPRQDTPPTHIVRHMRSKPSLSSLGLVHRRSDSPVARPERSSDDSPTRASRGDHQVSRTETSPTRTSRDSLAPPEHNHSPTRSTAKII